MILPGGRYRIGSSNYHRTWKLTGVKGARKELTYFAESPVYFPRPAVELFFKVFIWCDMFNVLELETLAHAFIPLSFFVRICTVERRRFGHC